MGWQIPWPIHEVLYHCQALGWARKIPPFFEIWSLFFRHSLGHVWIMWRSEQLTSSFSCDRCSQLYKKERAVQSSDVELDWIEKRIRRTDDLTESSNTEWGWTRKRFVLRRWYKCKISYVRIIFTFYVVFTICVRDDESALGLINSCWTTLPLEDNSEGDCRWPEHTFSFTTHIKSPLTPPYLSIRLYSPLEDTPFRFSWSLKCKLHFSASVVLTYTICTWSAHIKLAYPNVHIYIMYPDIIILYSNKHCCTL